MEDYMYFINNEYSKGVDGDKDEMYYFCNYQYQFEMNITLSECLAFINGVLEDGLPKLTAEDLQDQKVSYSIAKYLRDNIYRTVGHFDTEAFLSGEGIDWDYWKKCLFFDECFMPDQELVTPCDYIVQDIYKYGRDGIGGKKSQFDEEVISEIWKNFEDSDHMMKVIYGDYRRNEYGGDDEVDEVGDMLEKVRLAFNKSDNRTNGWEKE